MKKFILLFILFSIICTTCFSVTMEKIRKTFSDVNKIIPYESLNYSIDFLDVNEFDNFNTSFIKGSRELMAFTRCFEYEDGSFAKAIIVLRKEILDMDDDFFDEHYAHIIAHEICHVATEQYIDKGGESHGYSFNVVQTGLNRSISNAGSYYNKYKQSIGDNPYDYELTCFFDKYRK